jgi:hypothetical protein
MAKNNNLLYTAAVNGAVAGGVGGSFPITTTVGAYTKLVAAATAYAEEIDSQIANDATISAVGGVALPPTTAAIQQAQLQKSQLIEDLSRAVFEQRFSTDAVEADYTNLAEAVVTIYTPTVTAGSSY